MPGERRSSDERRGQGAARAPSRSRQIPALEWIVAGLGALLVVGTIAYLIFQAIGRDETPPDVRVVALRVLEVERGYLVEFRATNYGGQAAAQLLIEGELGGEGAPVEISEATLDYLPPRSDREGGLFFSRDPRRHELKLRAKGYAKP